jgi:hypothetical protein
MCADIVPIKALAEAFRQRHFRLRLRDHAAGKACSRLTDTSDSHSLFAQFALNFFDSTQRPLQLLGKGSGELVLGDSDGLGNVAQSIFSNEAVPGLTENQAYAWLVVRMPEQFVYRRKVEVHLTCKFRSERLHFQIDDHEGSKIQVIEE